VEINNLWGLPAHPLIVHAIVALVPLTAAGAVVSTFFTGIRARIGWLVALGAVLDVLLLPLVTGSGESLEERVSESTLVERHADMGEQLLPWVIGLAVAFVLLMLAHRSGSRQGSPGEFAATTLATPWVAVLLAVVTVVAAIGATVQVARIGHSGAKATWSDTAPSSDGGGDD
jgi:hypothetical protein